MSHRGESADGFYLNTLCVVDIARSWTEGLPVWGKGQEQVNFFPPTMKLLDKTGSGAKAHKVEDKAQTPYQRLLRAGIPIEAKQSELAATEHYLNPVHF